MIPLRVGICIIEYTRMKLQLPALLEELTKDGSMTFSVIDMDQDLHDQGPFDVIVHKILEWYNLGEHVGDAKLMALSDYVLTCNPHVKVLDPIAETVRLADRFYSMEVLRACEFTMNGVCVSVPAFAYIDKGQSDKALEILGANGIQFPIITKPPFTRCDAEAHDMSIIFSEDCIRDLPTPCVAQQFVNHNSMLYKIAAVGEQYYVCERPSVKNLDDTYVTADTIYFDSLSVSKRDRHNPDLHSENPRNMKFRTTGVADDDGLDGGASLLNDKIIRELLRRIRDKCSLSLFGIDIIVEEGTKNYCLIDLNYLPSYDGVLRQAARALRDLLKVYQTKPGISSSLTSSSPSISDCELSE